MIKGVSFSTPQAFDHILQRIFKTVDVEKYDWYIIRNQTEVWSESGNQDFFAREKYSGTDFSDLIALKHKIVFLKLQAYVQAKKCDNIQTYPEFQSSDCQMLLLISDCELVEIYSKSESVLSEIYKNAVSEKFMDIVYITDQNDCRNTMDIL